MICKNTVLLLLRGFVNRGSSAAKPCERRRRRSSLRRHADLGT